MVHAYHVIWGPIRVLVTQRPAGFLVGLRRVMGVGPLWPGDAVGGCAWMSTRQQWARWRAAAVQSLQFPPVNLSGLQARAVGTGFANSVRKSHLTIWACSILPEHVHLVIARHTYKVEQICILLKGEATKQLNAESIHPQVKFRDAHGKLPSMWAERQWKVFLDSEEAIEAAIRYVEENPLKEGERRRNGRLSRRLLGSPSAAGPRITDLPHQTCLTRSQRRRCCRDLSPSPLAPG